MTLVLDSSAAVSALLNDGAARALVRDERLHSPHLADSEVASVLRRHVAGGRITSLQGWAALDAWRRLGLRRHPSTAHLERVWQLRGNVSAYDAAYVALAESLGCALVTGDGRLGRARGIRCPVTVVPG